MAPDMYFLALGSEHFMNFYSASFALRRWKRKGFCFIFNLFVEKLARELALNNGHFLNTCQKLDNPQ